MTRRDAVAKLLDDFEGAVLTRERWARGDVTFEHLTGAQAASRLTVHVAAIRQRILALVEEMVPLLDVELAREAIPRRPTTVT